MYGRHPGERDPPPPPLGGPSRRQAADRRSKERFLNVTNATICVFGYGLSTLRCLQDLSFEPTYVLWGLPPFLCSEMC